MYQNNAFSRLGLARAALESLIQELAPTQKPERGSSQVRVDGRLWRRKYLRPRWACMILCADDPHAGTRAAEAEAAPRAGGGHLLELDIPVQVFGETTQSQPTNGDSEDVLLDWTRFEIPGMPNYVRYMRNFDWSGTGVGRMETWPIELRQSVVHICANPNPRCIIWGEDQIFIYNEAAAPLFGKKHPEGMGQPIQLLFAELWDEVRSLFRRAYNGETMSLRTMPLTMERGDGPEETYWDFILIPIVGGSAASGENREAGGQGGGSAVRDWEY